MHIDKEVNFRPKGSMCMACEKVKQDCSKFEFSKMPVIGTDKDGVKVVKCVRYEVKSK